MLFSNRLGCQCRSGKREAWPTNALEFVWSARSDVMVSFSSWTVCLRCIMSVSNGREFQRSAETSGRESRSLVCVGIRVTWRGESGLERELGRWEMGVMVDIDIKRSSTRMGLGVMLDRVQAWVQPVPCHNRGRCESVLRGLSGCELIGSFVEASLLLSSSMSHPASCKWSRPSHKARTSPCSK